MNDPVTEAFFVERHGLFIGNGIARGPWDPTTCHAGPPTGLIARALELRVPGRRLVRLTVELNRPIPMAGFTIDTDSTRSGRGVTTTSATLATADGTACAIAYGLHMEPTSQPHLPTAPGNPTDLGLAKPGPFPIATGLHDQAQFGKAVEARYPPDQNPAPGPTTVWLKTPALLAGEDPTPFQRLCPIADCGNAFSRNAEPADVIFVNPDLTISMHREPIGRWLGSSSISHWHDDGIGLADAELFDEIGPVGRATQTLLLRRNQPGTSQ
ncbi:MAG: thioesterase family protein [Acidimicrobiales bacterium]